ncbi:transcriptional regulator, TetR family [Microbulbifer donghaiensis]|uniref:Transcriptional regulator, TetR family n=1 Tax=Microbulbifer donghaiensis TaxID=494016 RepID=A0A1M4UIM6_9GAMM|nr:TetR family transcriptional regulator [Microbulbifer donghaiensis]SHE56547.1 transcriptional regulator, TetR family [Microbulbifer donghaiensis]
MAKRRKEEAQETRERILDAAITVFHKHGVARPSLTEVAELAGVTRGAVYGHFRNKADLLNTLAERIKLPGEKLCESAGEELKRDPLGLLRTRWLWLFEEVACNREWQLILEIIFHRCELVTESGEIQQRMMQGRAEGIERMRELVCAAVAQGQLPADLNIGVAVPMLHGSLIGLLQEWLLDPQVGDLAELGERYIDSLIDMVRFSATLRHEYSAVALH